MVDVGAVDGMGGLKFEGPAADVGLSGKKKMGCAAS